MVAALRISTGHSPTAPPPTSLAPSLPHLALRRAFASPSPTANDPSSVYLTLLSVQCRTFLQRCLDNAFSGTQTGVSFVCFILFSLTYIDVSLLSRTLHLWITRTPTRRYSLVYELFCATHMLIRPFLRRLIHVRLHPPTSPCLCMYRIRMLSHRHTAYWRLGAPWRVGVCPGRASNPRRRRRPRQ